MNNTFNYHTVSSINDNNSDFIHPVVKVGKRAFDIVFSVIAIIMFLPILPFIALAIKLDSKGPVFYRQIRLGKYHPDHTDEFKIIKFRTMYTDAEASGKELLACKGDPRITKIGRFLRKTRIDEIPQFLNILLGEMSLIGPRPERPGLTNEIESRVPFFAERTYGVMPGITGFAQINQSYLDSVGDINTKVSYDHAYALTLSNPVNWVITDIKIIFSTILVVIKANG